MSGFWLLLGGMAVGRAVGFVEEATGWGWPFFVMAFGICAWPVWEAFIR